MTPPPYLGLVFDLIVIVLLIITILYSAKLSRLSLLFQRIKNDQKDMEQLLEQLSNIIDKANNAVQGMKEAASNDGERLQKNIDEAKDIADELEIMLNSGNNLAKRLEKLAEQSGTIRKKKKKTPSEKMLLDAIGEGKKSKK